MKKMMLVLGVFCCSAVCFFRPLYAETALQEDFSAETSGEAGALPDMTLSDRGQHEEGSDPEELISCHRISVEECPIDRCAVMTNCRGQQICYFKMIDPPACGNLSYAGQHVPCCPGLVRRCGMAFLDMSCDLHGDNSEYHLPICIPCGDGICGNFENVCNCPEDCWPRDDAPEYGGWRFDEEAAVQDAQPAAAVEAPVQTEEPKKKKGLFR